MSPERADKAEQIDEDALERAADEAIAECDGDARAAVKALLVANAFLEASHDKALDLVSRGYARGKFDTR